MTNENNEKKSFVRESVEINFAQLSGMILKDLNASSSSNVSTNFTQENVATYLGNPTRYSKNLVNMSNALFHASNHYKRLVNYYAHMPKLHYYIEPYKINLEKVNEKALRNAYQKTLDYIDNMNIKHEFKKALSVAWREDTFYGYEHEAKDSYFIQQLPNEFCQISSIEDGVYNFSFNFKYFDRNEIQLELYPKEFKSMYNKYKNGSQGEWQELDSTKTICIKVNEESTIDVPPLAGIFANIFDIQDYKNLKKTKTTIGNYKFMVQKIPLRDKSERNNDFLVDLDTAKLFHNKTITTLPDEIGLISTPFDVDTVDFAKDSSEKDAVHEAEREMYTSAGISSQLFNGDKASNANLGKSINVDENEVFSVLRQIERLINKKLKQKISGTVKFRLKFLDSTTFNEADVTENLLKLSQYGLPVKSMLSASVGLEPSSITSLTYLENEILGLHEKFIPLSSSHTQGGDQGADPTDEGGAPKKKEDELSDKGEEQVERGDNENSE